MKQSKHQTPDGRAAQKCACCRRKMSGKILGKYQKSMCKQPGREVQACSSERKFSCVAAPSVGGLNLGCSKGLGRKQSQQKKLWP